MECKEMQIAELYSSASAHINSNRLLLSYSLSIFVAVTGLSQQQVTFFMFDHDRGRNTRREIGQRAHGNRRELLFLILVKRMISSLVSSFGFLRGKNKVQHTWRRERALDLQVG